MQHKYKNMIFAALALVFTASISTSCIGDLNVLPSDPNITQEFHQDAVFARVYAGLVLTGQRGPAGEGDIEGMDEGMSGFFRMIWNLNTLTTDEGICAWGDAPVVDLNFNQWSSMNSQINGLFARLYVNISFANHFLSETEGLMDDKTRRQRAEVRFIRALNWFYLMDMFGDVVFVDRVMSDGTLPQRILRADLFRYIIEELSAIEEDMYAPRQAPQYRVDQAANWLLKSRIFLNAEVYAGTARWTDAAGYAKRVMDSAYELSPVFSHLFMADNDGSGTVNEARQEIIFPLAHHGQRIKSYAGTTFLIASTRVGGMPASGLEGMDWAGNRARASLISYFFPGNIPDEAFVEPGVTGAGDHRAMFFVNGRTREIADRNGVGQFIQGYSVVKFSNLRADGGATSDPNFADTDLPLMRAAEAYLNFAEATLRAGGSQSDALAAVNILRARANAPALTSITIIDVLDEKAREFYFEGHRRTDLIRFGHFGGGTYNWDWKGGVAAGTPFGVNLNVFPIPAGQINANPNLIQNTGY
jgi:hypothetical protein